LLNVVDGYTEEATLAVDKRAGYRKAIFLKFSPSKGIFIFLLFDSFILLTII
jgi:hypothetical protein